MGGAGLSRGGAAGPKWSDPLLSKLRYVSDLMQSIACVQYDAGIFYCPPLPPNQKKNEAHIFTIYVNHIHPSINQSSRRRPTRLPIRDLRLWNQLAVGGEICILIPRWLDPAVEDRHLQTPQLLQPDLAQIVPLGSPLQVLLQIRPERAWFQIGDCTGVVQLDQFTGQRDLADDVQVLAVVHGVVHEDDEGADEARGGFEPGGRIGGHVADEDVDEEGFLQGEFVDADVGVPFAVGAVGAVFERWRDGDGCPRVAVSLALVHRDAARGELIVWIIELFDCGARVGAHLVGGQPPIAHFGVGVAERAGGADVGRCIQRGAGVGVEGG